MTAMRKPVLSVVIAIDSDTTKERARVTHLSKCLDALARQIDAPAMELIVPYHDAVDGIEDLKQRFTDVNFLAVNDLHSTLKRSRGREHHDVLRARGLLAASGVLVSLLEDHSLPDANWCANITTAHQEGYACVGGAIENRIDRPLSWAVYFCDFGKYQNPLPAGESTFASDCNVSYKRAALESIRAAWEESFREVIVHGRLLSCGEKMVLRPDIIVYQNRSDLQLGDAIRERFIWGRSYAATRNALLSMPKKVVFAGLSPALPLILTQRIALITWKRRRNFRKFLRSLHWIVLLQASWALGEGVGYLTGLGSSTSTNSK